MKNLVLTISLKSKLDDVLEDHIKAEKPYTETTVHDPQTIDDEIEQKNEDFLQTAAEFNKIDMAATAHKKGDFYNNLFDVAIDVSDSR